ncbi:MAG: hypothetical protein II350_08620 [Clostridia bacterium]|nr:hypothetical protein [Clostridia bacterium]
MICPVCGNECLDDARFCSSCGIEFVNNESSKAVSEPVDNTKEQQNVLNKIRNYLKYRRLACIIVGILRLVSAMFYLFGGTVMIISTIISLTGNSSFDLPGIGFAYTILYFMCGIIYIPLAIVNFAIAAKSNKLMSGVYTDVRPAADYCGSVGQLVLCALFNEIALVFAIIGMVHVKRNAEVINMIEQNQMLNK